MLLIAIFMTLVAVGLAAAAVAERSIWMRLWLGGTALLCGAIAVSGFWQSRKRTIPLISVGDEGIVHVKIGPIRWDEIEKVAPYSIGGQTMTGIWTADPYLPAKRGKTWWMWPFVLLNRMLGAPAISFPGSIAPVDELIAEIEERRSTASVP
jgi:hypothetical protein